MNGRPTPTGDPDRDARDVFLALFFAADRRRWDDIVALLADDVHLDYSSLNGVEAAVRRGSEVVAGWQSLIPGYDATHHQLVVVGTDSVEGAIQLLANGTTTHVLTAAPDDPFWTVAGHYAATIVRAPRGWVVSSLVFSCSWRSGNPDLPSLARQQVARQSS